MIVPAVSVNPVAEDCEPDPFTAWLLVNDAALVTSVAGRKVEVRVVQVGTAIPDTAVTTWFVQVVAVPVPVAAIAETKVVPLEP